VLTGSAPPPRYRTASIVGLTVALGAPFVLPFLPGQAPSRITDVAQDVHIAAFEWVVALALLAIVLFWERLPLRSIGFRPLSARDCIALAAAVVSMYLVLGIVAASHGGSRASGPTPAQIAALPLLLRVVLFLTAGFCEELMLRAYAIERLTQFTGMPWVGGVIAIVLFTLAHVPRYGFSESLMNVAIISAFITALYLYTRNFFACAIMHAFIDFIGLVLGPALAPHASA
jgi:membrane protease YdiL (CAAX protease family)